MISDGIYKAWKSSTTAHQIIHRNGQSKKTTAVPADVLSRLNEALERQTKIAGENFQRATRAEEALGACRAAAHNRVAGQRKQSGL